MAISKNLLNEGETVVFDTRTHPKALILPFLALVVTLAVAALVPLAPLLLTVIPAEELAARLIKLLL